MARRYKRGGGGSGYKSKTSRYSNETTVFKVTGPVSANQTVPYDTEHTAVKGCTIVSSTPVYGTRKVKNFEIQCVAQANFADPVYGALVYVPEGTHPSALLAGDHSSLYEPNQNVIAQFVIPPTLGNSQTPTIVHVKNKLARNLDSGDCIVLVFVTSTQSTATGANALQISGTVNYAIKF